MKVDQDQFREQGYLILRNVIPPDKLGAMRASCEIMLDSLVKTRFEEVPAI